MIVVARRQLHGTYGTVTVGDQFVVDDETASELLKRGLVGLPEKAYAKKVVTPPETKPKVIKRSAE